jgi:putative endonuclease
MINGFYFVYILESLKDQGWYIGFTSDINRRIIQHNKGENISTKARIPLKLIYFEGYVSKNDAEGRERFLKSGAGRRFLKKQLNNYLTSL